MGLESGHFWRPKMRSKSGHFLTSKWASILAKIEARNEVQIWPNLDLNWGAKVATFATNSCQDRVWLGDPVWGSPQSWPPPPQGGTPWDGGLRLVLHLRLTILSISSSLEMATPRYPFCVAVGSSFGDPQMGSPSRAPHPHDPMVPNSGPSFANWAHIRLVRGPYCA